MAKMAEAVDQSVSDNLNTKNGNFICGVVEGIYFSLINKSINSCIKLVFIVSLVKIRFGW